MPGWGCCGDHRITIRGWRPPAVERGSTLPGVYHHDRRRWDHHRRLPRTHDRVSEHDKTPVRLSFVGKTPGVAYRSGVSLTQGARTIYVLTIAA